MLSLVASCMCRDLGDQTLNLGVSGGRSKLLSYLSGQGFRFVILMLAVYLKREREAVGGEGSKFLKKTTGNGEDQFFLVFKFLSDSTSKLPGT